jgi:hypothetical protein
MKASSVRFRCPCCRARIKAPAQLRGQRRDCPACGRPFVVPRPATPDDVGPILVLVENNGRCRLGVAYRRGA